MGKSQVKKKTRREGRHNPMRVPDGHLGKSGAPDHNVKETEMLPILKKLSAPEYSDRTWACAAISNLIQNDAATRRLFQGKNVIGLLIERLSDDVDEVVVEASGALRNLGIDGGHELCAEMYNKGIMSHLPVLITKCTDLINTILTSASPATTLSDTDYQARKHLLALTENILSLVWSLAEANHKTLAAINAANVENLLLLSLRGTDTLGLGVSLAAAQALYSLSQDNPDFQSKLLHSSSAMQSLVEILTTERAPVDGKRKGKGKASGTQQDAEDGRWILLRVLLSGSLRNLVGASSDKALQDDIKTLTNETILPLVDGLLDVDLDDVVRQVMQQVNEMGQADQQIKSKSVKGAATDHRSPAEIALERIERLLMTVTVGLEVLTGICAGIEDQEDPALEEVDGDDAEEDDDEEMAEGGDELFDQSRGMDAAPNGNHVQANVATPVTLQYLISTLGLPSRLLKLSTLTPLSFPPASSQPSPHPPTTSILSVLHLRALEALNNLLLTCVASGSQLASALPVADIWRTLFDDVDAIKSEPHALGQKGQEMRMEVLEMCLGCLWGVAKLAPDAVGCTAQQMAILMEAVPALSSDVAKTRCTETLAALASRQSVTVDENRAVGQWLMTLLTTELHPEIMVAVLNAIIDIYADETRTYDQAVFVSGGFLDILSGSLRGVKAKVKGIDRRKELRLRARAEEASDNLTAFVQYRKNLQA